MGDSASALFAAFTASGPDPTIEARLALFGQFVGSWDLSVTDFDDDVASTTPGEWHFGWALAGRAVADIWICPRRTSNGASPGKHGLSVRFPELDSDAWRSTWIEPGRGIVYTFSARAVGDEIVLRGRFRDAVETRWTFSEISHESFRWRNEESLDGREWRLNQTFAAARA